MIYDGATIEWRKSEEGFEARVSSSFLGFNQLDLIPVEIFVKNNRLGITKRFQRNIQIESYKYPWCYTAEGSSFVIIRVTKD